MDIGSTLFCYGKHLIYNLLICMVWDLSAFFFTTMKKTLFIVAILCCSFACFAQNESYNKIYASFVTGVGNLSGIGVPDKVAKEYVGNVDSWGHMGFNVGYSRGINLGKSLPLFLELGGEINYTSGTEEGEYYGSDCDYSISLINVSVPVNVTYRVPVSEGFAIAPFAGVNFKYNAMGLVKGKTRKGESDWYSVFNEKNLKKYLGTDEGPNVFQIGLNVGVNFVVSNKFVFGYRFQPDLMDYFKYEKSYYGEKYGAKIVTNTHAVSLGLIF